jgi:hypothetical protein
MDKLRYWDDISMYVISVYVSFPCNTSPYAILPHTLCPSVFKSPYVSSLQCGAIFMVRLG